MSSAKNPSPEPSSHTVPLALAALLAAACFAWALCTARPPDAVSVPDAAVSAPDDARTEPVAEVTEAPAPAPEVPTGAACDPACGAGTYCHERVCHAFAEVSCGGRAACDGPDGRQCYDAVSPCDTGFSMTPCQSPGRRECRDGAVVCIPHGRTAGGCSPPSGGTCDPEAQCRCPAERPSSCADWWAQPGARVCVDMLSDDAHCGGCDRVCDSSGLARSVCRAGHCVCPAGTVACDEQGPRAAYVRCRRECADAGSDAGTDAGTDAPGALGADAPGDAPDAAVRDGARATERRDAVSDVIETDVSG